MENLGGKAAPAPNSITLSHWNRAARQGVSNQSNHIQSASTRVQLSIHQGTAQHPVGASRTLTGNRKSISSLIPCCHPYSRLALSYSCKGATHTAYLQADLHRNSVFCQTRTSCLCCSWVPGLSSLLLLHISCWEPKETWHRVLLRCSVCNKCVSHTLPYMERILSFAFLQPPLYLFPCVGSSNSSLKLQ